MQTKRAIALSGGGPPVGLEVGALQALDEQGIEFDIFTTCCIGSWTACIYNSHSGKERIEKLKEFYANCFVPDDIFEGFSVPINIFVTDYFEDFCIGIEKLCDLNTYQGLWLPERIVEMMMHYSNPENYPKDTVDLSLMMTKAMSLNPFSRLMFKLYYQNKKTGRSWLLGPKNHGSKLVSQFIDFDKLMELKSKIYVNVFNLSKQRIDLFTNRTSDKKYKPISLNVLKGNSSILGYLANRVIDGDKYCEGAVADTVNFGDLIKNHPEIEEVWVINILDYKEIKPPENLLEADLLGVELPFATIAHDDVKLFQFYLKEAGKDKKINVIKIDMTYKELDFFWRQSTFDKGVEVGYQCTKKALKAYMKEKAAVTALN